MNVDQLQKIRITKHVTLRLYFKKDVHLIYGQNWAILSILPISHCNPFELAQVS